MLFIAFIGGLITIAAPCILTVLPILLGSTLGQQNKLRPLMIVLGLTVSFTGFGILFASVTTVLGLSSNTLRNIALILLGLFSLALIFPITYEKILFSIQNVGRKIIAQKKTTSSSIQKPAKKGLLNGFIVGASLGLVWVPCAGPILGAILTYSVTQKNLWDTAALLLAYSAGAGLPMLIIAYGGNAIISKLKILKTNGQKIQQVSGIILLLGVILISTGLDVKISTGLAGLFPNLNQVEQNLLDGSSGKTPNPIPPPSSTNSSNSKVGSLLLPPKLKAPEITGTQAWVNSEPLTLAQLKGKVVIIDFWTYSCINCIRTLPYLKMWNEKYKESGLVIIGVHSPEFAFEKELGNVQKAVKDFDLKNPVVQDNDFSVWKAYENNYWPAKYIIDQNGFIRYTHFGEGNYDETEEVIKELLEEAGTLITSNQNFSSTMEVQKISAVDFTKIESAETYLGSERSEYHGQTILKTNELQTFEEPTTIENNKYYLSGEWQINGEYITPKRAQAKLYLNYKASKVNLVIGADTGVKSLASSAKIYLDGKIISPEDKGADVATDGTIIFHKDALYNLVDTKNRYERHTITIEFLNAAITKANAYAFTFG